jgi:hypothetical protein
MPFVFAVMYYVIKEESNVVVRLVAYVCVCVCVCMWIAETDESEGWADSPNSAKPAT